jgi:hypothetical protein
MWRNGSDAPISQQHILALAIKMLARSAIPFGGPGSVADKGGCGHGGLLVCVSQRYAQPKREPDGITSKMHAK